MRDFTPNTYELLLRTALKNGYKLVSYLEFLSFKENDKVIVLRHDVDDLPENSLQTAILENKLGVSGTYYFRVVKQSYNEEIILKIKALGHEIGYHYEDLALNNGDLEKSFDHFKSWLEKFRKLSEIKTICMHGSPLSKWDNREIWKKYNYKELGILAEPYFDTDFKKVLYLTDTGRKWNNTAASIRDKVDSAFKINVSSTKDIVILLEQGKMPQQIMINIHPQRWTNRYFPWYKELIFQNFKNLIKKQLIKNK